MLQHRRLPAVARLLVAAAVLALARAAAADPQVSAAATLGGGSASLGDHDAAVFHLGARGDLLLLRSRERDMGIGPYVAVGSEAFRTFAAQGGLEWLVPAWGDIPFVFSAGAFERSDAIQGWQPGVVGALFWGPHGYNFDGPYDMSGGIFVEGRHAIGDARENALLAGVSIDLSLLAYPFLLAYGAIAH